MTEQLGCNAMKHAKCLKCDSDNLQEHYVKVGSRLAHIVVCNNCGAFHKCKMGQHGIARW